MIVCIWRQFDTNSLFCCTNHPHLLPSTYLTLLSTKLHIHKLERLAYTHPYTYLPFIAAHPPTSSNSLVILLTLLPGRARVSQGGALLFITPTTLLSQRTSARSVRFTTFPRCPPLPSHTLSLQDSII